MKIKRTFGLALIMSALMSAPVSASVSHGGGQDSGGVHSHPRPAITVASCVDISDGSFTDSEVARIQKALKSGGYKPGPIDGAYGKQTRMALNKFEKKKSLKLSPGESMSLNSIKRLGVAC